MSPKGASPSGRIPYVQQMEAADCGAACLAMVLGLHGRRVTLGEAREAAGAGRGGVSAADLIEAGERFGLRGRGVRLEVEELGLLPRGSVLHWAFSHFVVFDRAERGAIRVVDPASGPRLIPLEEVRRDFTGVALTFEPGETFEPGGKAPSGLLDFARRFLAHRGAFARVLVLSVLIQAFALALPLLIGVLVDRVVPRGDVGLLGLLAFGMLSVVAFHAVALLVRAHLLLYLRAVMDTELSLGFMEHLSSLPYAFFLERPAGDLIARYDSNREIRQTLTSSSLSALLDGALVSVYLLLLLAASPPMGLLVLVLGLAQVGLFLALRRRYKDLMTRELEVAARSQSHLVEMLSGMETLKAAGSERRSVQRWSHLFVDELNVALTRGRLSAWMGAVTSALNIASPLLILMFGAWLVLEGRLSLGMMLALNALAAGFLVPLSNLVNTAVSLQELRSHVERVMDVLSAAPEQRPEGARRASRLTGGIVVEGVSFRYRRGEAPVLRDVSVEIAPGQKVAIVGRSGAGKSTLARLLVGLYRPESGRILYDGADLATLDLRSVREQIGVVTQEARVFGLSVRENICLSSPDLPLEAAMEAARLAEIHEEILSLPMTYDTLLTDAGASLSGGQRQRIALARALARRPSVLLLDEATSDLDAVTEARIMENLSRLRCTRIVIAHRLSTVADADLILVLDGGRLAEAGTHKELLARGGRYADLVAAQAG